MRGAERELRAPASWRRSWQRFKEVKTCVDDRGVSAGTGAAPWVPRSLPVRRRPLVSGDPAHQHTGQTPPPTPPAAWEQTQTNGASASGPAEGGGGERPRAGQADPGGEEGAEDGAVSGEGDEGEPGTAAHLRAPEQRCERPPCPPPPVPRRGRK